MRVLITGASGFIGTHLIGMLKDSEHELALLVRSSQKVSHFKTANTMLLEGSLDGLKCAKKTIQEFAPEVCIHLAWEGIPDYSAAISTLNLHRSIELINFLSGETMCKKIVVSGTCFEYGKTKGECNEVEPVQTTSFIAWAKQSLYNYLSLLCKKSAISFVWFRIFYVYGPGQRVDSLIPTIVQAFLKGEKPRIRNPFNSHDFIYIKDAAKAIRLAVEKNVDSGIYNLGSGEASSVLEVCKIVEQQISGSCSFSENISHQSKSQEYDCFWANIEKTKKSFGWEPQYSLTAGIQQFIQSV